MLSTQRVPDAGLGASSAPVSAERQVSSARFSGSRYSWGEVSRQDGLCHCPAQQPDAEPARELCAFKGEGTKHARFSDKGAASWLADSRLE